MSQGALYGPRDSDNVKIQIEKKKNRPNIFKQSGPYLERMINELIK